MPMGLGYQFAPGADNGSPNSEFQSRRGLSPQASVKLLQLRVPERPAANAPVPQQILSGAPGVASAGTGGLQQIIQALMQARGGQSQMSSMPFQGGGAPSPPPAQAQQAPPLIPTPRFGFDVPVPTTQPTLDRGFGVPGSGSGGGSGLPPDVSADYQKGLQDLFNGTGIQVPGLF